MPLRHVSLEPIAEPNLASLPAFSDHLNLLDGVYQDETVRTGKGGSLHVLFLDKTGVRLGPDAELALMGSVRGLRDGPYMPRDSTSWSLSSNSSNFCLNEAQAGECSYSGVGGWHGGLAGNSEAQRGKEAYWAGDGSRCVSTQKSSEQFAASLS